MYNLVLLQLFHVEFVRTVRGHHEGLKFVGG